MRGTQGPESPGKAGGEGRGPGHAAAQGLEGASEGAGLRDAESEEAEGDGPRRRPLHCVLSQDRGEGDSGHGDPHSTLSVPAQL